MVMQITEHLERWSTDSSVRAILFTGAGTKAFCAGGDVRLLASVPSYPEQFLRNEYRMNYSISNYFARHGKPIVSLIPGIVMGGGVGVSMHGNYRVCNESTMFAMPETTIGFFPDVGGTFLLPRLQGATLPRAAGSVGMYLGLTGARVRTGSDLLLTGIATHFVPVKSWQPMVSALCTESIGSDIVRDLPALLNRYHELPMPVEIPEAKVPPPLFSKEVLALLEACFGTHVHSIDDALSRLDSFSNGKMTLQIPQIDMKSASGSLQGSDASPMLHIKKSALDQSSNSRIMAFAANTAKELRSKSPFALKVCSRSSSSFELWNQNYRDQLDVSDHVAGVARELCEGFTVLVAYRVSSGCPHDCRKRL
jgi:enoyl-CoA hydratase/carnithine racemase